MLLVLAACLAAVNEYLSEATQGGRVYCADGLKYFRPSRKDIVGSGAQAASHNAGESFEGMEGRVGGKSKRRVILEPTFLPVRWCSSVSGRHSRRRRLAICSCSWTARDWLSDDLSK